MGIIVRIMVNLTKHEIKRDGVHYTPIELADFISSKIVAHAKRLNLFQSENIRLVDPAVGDGELIVSLLKHLNGLNYLNIDVTIFEKSESAISLAKTRIKSQDPDIKITEKHGDFLEYIISGNRNQIDLFNNVPALGKYDLLIANPPYVRTQQLGAEQSQNLNRIFDLRGRVDLSFPFILGMIDLLSEDGVAGIVTSNRFLTTKAGYTLREKLIERCSILEVIDLGDTKLFDAAVLPCVLVFKKKDQASVPTNFISIYSSTSSSSRPDSKMVIQAIESQKSGEVLLGSHDSRYTLARGTLDLGESPGDIWKVSNKGSDQWIGTVQENTQFEFSDVGKIRVGVKTTSDKVFIRDDWEKTTKGNLPEKLFPLTTHHIARRFTSDAPKKKILYTHEMKGGKRSPIDLDEYPLSQQYLETHKAKLSSREYVIKAGRNWYEIWVPQDPEVWDKPKIVFKDIAVKPTFWLDLEGTIVNGDCYFISFNKSKNEDLMWLMLGIANSSFIEEFYDRKFNNKLYSGRRRFITQYVEKFPIPYLSNPLSKNIISLSKKAYQAKNGIDLGRIEKELDENVYKAFGLSKKKSDGSGI